MRSPRPCFNCLLLVALLEIVLPQTDRAEGSATYKFQSWREDGDRIRVTSQAAQVEQGFPGDIKFKLSGVIDSISGATPTGQPADASGQVVLSQMEDRRKAWQAEASRPFDRVTLSIGGANSRESDYVSNGGSFNTLTDFNQKNTTLLLGIAGTSDRVKVYYQPEWVKKHGYDLIAGVTQLIDPNTTFTANISFGHVSGYLADPYKIIQKNTEILPGIFLPLTFVENRPDKRSKWTAFLGSNHAFKEQHGAVDLSYRYYRDDFGLHSHTVEAQWIQNVTDSVIFQTSARWYHQSAANFYRLSLDGSAIEPTLEPNPAGPFYSADYRLSRMRTLSLSAKLVWKLASNRVQLDAEYQRYTMRGLDGMTPRSAYTDANVYTVGARVAW